MAIKIFDFACPNGHKFEGWFSSLEDCDRQQAEGLLTCPVCGSGDVVRVPTAGHIRVPRDGGESIGADRDMLTELMAYVRDAAGRAEDVGGRFAEEARAIHAGRSARRMIRGICSVGEAEKLLEEGVMVLPVPESAGKTLN